MTTWINKDDLNEAKSDSWLDTAKASTDVFVESLKSRFGYGNEPKTVAIAEPPPMDIRLPTAEEWHAAAPWREKPVQTPSGTPAAMPTAPRTVDATITAGPRPGQSLQPGESVGSVTLGPIKEGDPQGFFESARGYADAVEREYGIPAAFTLAVAANETGYGQRRYMAGDNNYHGIQDSTGTGTPYTDWRPGPNGEKVYYEARQAGFATPAEGFRGFGRFLTENPRYQPAIQRYQQTGDAAQFARDVHAAGYAEDPQWSTKVTSIMGGIPVSTGVGEVTAPQGVGPQSQRTPMPAEQTPQAQQQGAWSAGSYTPNQINAATSEGLDYETALAVCGPAAAIAFARKTGRNPTMQEAVGLAREVGWTPDAGMAGPASQQRLLQRMGVASRLTEGSPDWQSVAADVQRGNPVTISTPGHYFVAERYDPESGAFDFGESAAVLKASGGRRWFRPEELVNLGMGEARAVLFIDNPESPTPSIAADPRQSLNAGAGSPQPAPAPSPQAAAGVPPTSGGSELWSPDMPAEGQQMAYQAATGRSGGSGVMYRGPLGAAPAEVGNDAPYDPRDADSGPWEAPATSSYNDPTAGGTQSVPIQSQSSPNVGPNITIADGRTEPPTPTGDWQPVETVPMPSQTPYGPPLSEAGPEEPPNPYGAPRSIAADINPAAPAAPPVPSEQPGAREAAMQQAEDRYGQVTSTPGEPDYVDNRPLTVFHGIEQGIRSAQGPGGILEPAAGLPRIMGRLSEIQRQAAAELGRNPMDQRVLDDAGWRARNPQLAAEVDDLRRQGELSMLGNLDAPRRVAQGAAQIAAPVAREAAAPLWQVYSRAGDLIHEAASQAEASAWARQNARNADIVPPARVPSLDAIEAARAQEIQPRPQADAPMDTGRLGEATQPDSGRVPPHNFSEPDLETGNVKTTEAVVRRHYGGNRKGVDVYQSYVRVDELPDGKIDNGPDGEIDSLEEYMRPTRRGFPPIKVRVDADGKVAILDGNHRIEAWRQAGYDYAPAWVVDERNVRNAPRAARGLVGRAVEGARAAGRAALQAGGADARVPSSLGSGMVPDRTPRRTGATRNAAPQFEDTYESSGARQVVDAYEAATPERIQEAQRRAVQIATDQIAGEKAPPAVRQRVSALIDEAVAEGERMLDGSKVVATGIDGRALDALIDGEGFTNKFAGLDNIEDAIDATWERVGKTRITREDAREFVLRELRADQMVLGEHNLNGRMYAHVTAGPPQIASGSKMINDAVEILPDGSMRPISAEQALAPGRREIRDRYMAAGFSDIGSGFVPRGADLRNAAQGGVIGAASELTSDEELTPQERIARMTIGGGLAVMAGRRAGRGVVQRAGSGMVPESSGSWDDIARRMDSPEQKAARDAASQPIRRAGDNQIIREEFGRPWEEVAPVKPGNPDRLGDATRQMVTEGQNFKGTRNRVLPADMEQIGGPVKIEPQSMSLNSVGGGLVGAGAGANSDEDLTDQERFERAAMGMVVGGVFMRRPKGQAAAAAADPTMQRMARMMNAPQVPTVANKRGLLERWAQAMTDDRAGLRTLQEAVSAKLGRPLGAGEMVAELTRRNAASIAGQRLAEELRPAIVKVGDDDDYLAQFLIHSHNVDVAREIGQRTYDDAIKSGATPAVASARAMQAANARKFSGDLTIAETQQQLAAIQQRVAGLPDGATRWQNIQDAAQAVWNMNKKTLDRKRDAGIISQDLYNELTQRYPRYVRTDIADYFDKGAGGGAATGPKRVGLSDIGVQKISAEGTTKERINPLYSTLDQTYAAEAAIARNESGQAFEELLRIDPTWQATFKEVVPAQGVNVGNPATTVPAGYTLRNGEQFLKVWKNGEARTFVVPPEYAALVSPQTGRVLGDNPAANGWRTLMQTYKSLITSKNPAFSYLVSPLRDLGDYAIQEATESAGKTQGVMGAAKAVGALPGILADYARAMPDVFAGITEGVYKGDLATMMRNGAGMMSRPQRNAKELKQAYEELRRTNGMEIRSMDDMKRVIGNVLTLGAEPVGGRLEQIPRLAAARRAARRGATPLDQTMRFRDATIDFQRAGEWSRVANELVPFFNVAVQSGAQTVRNFKKNPAAALASVATVVGGPAILAEVWNHRDEQTARDYEDVPDYLKKTGIVFMIPGVEGRNERGDRLPNYLYIPVGQYGALVQTAKETVRKVVEGKVGSPDPSDWSAWFGLAADIGGIFSPIRGDSAASAATSLIPPGLSTAADLAADTDLYRGSKISTDQRDENASALSQASAAYPEVAGGFIGTVLGSVAGPKGAAAGLAAGTAIGAGARSKESRPSQWEHTYRDLGGYAATLATTGSNMLAEATGQRRPKDEDRPIQSAPIVGGLVNRVIRDTGGQRMEDARSENTRVPESIRPILQEAGMRRDQVTGVPSKFRNAPLTREEQAAWQDATNALVTDEIMMVRDRADWDTKPDKRPDLIREAVSKAREKAAKEVLTDLTPAEIRDRIQTDQRRKAG